MHSDPATPRRRPLVLVAGLTAILSWQYVFLTHGDPEKTLATPYQLKASSGVLQWQPEFVYFLYYLNLYPVASISTSPREYSVAGAQRLIAEEGRTLVMDRYWTVRYGDLAKTYLYLPNAWLKGRPTRPRMLHANAFGFATALVALFAALWYVGRTTLATILIVLLGSNPFQVNEVFANNNLFGWPITFTLLMLALHVPLMRNQPPRRLVLLALAVCSGLLLGTFRQIRTEPTLVMLAVVAVYATTPRLSWRMRVALVLLVGTAYATTTSRWGRFFESKYREAHATVKAVGGHTYEGPRHRYHFFWHALWCGLGDFDAKYGYSWSDVAAFSYAWPILQHRYHYDPVGFAPVKADEYDSLTFGTYWDKGRQFARTPQEIPEYIQIVRDKALGDIVHDPGWYSSILARRATRIVTASTPPTLALGNGLHFSLPGNALWGILGIGIGLWLLRQRDWFQLKLVLFPLPLASTAFLVYSGGGTPLYSIAHLVAFAVGFDAVVAALGKRRLGLAALAGDSLLAWPRGVRQRVIDVASVPRDPVQAAAAPRPVWRRLRLPARVTGVGLVVLLGAWAVARRIVAAPSVTLGFTGAPELLVFRFENQTSSESLAWVGDALGEAVAARLRRAGVRLLGPDEVERLDADVAWWGPYGVLSIPETMAVNASADRSGAKRVVAGRVQGGRGLQACVRLLKPGAGGGLELEACEPIDEAQLPGVGERLAGALLPALGTTTTRPPSPSGPASPALRPYIEAQRAIRRQLWGEAVRFLDAAQSEDPAFAPARFLRSRLWAQWQAGRPDPPESRTGAASEREALASLKAAVAADATAIDPRVDLGRLMVQMELLDQATGVLEPLLSMPGAPAEAFGLLAEARSRRGDLAGGYQALLEHQRRSWSEPQGQSLLADHLVRWGDAFELAAGYLRNAELYRLNRGQAAVTLEDYAVQWRLHVLEERWSDAEAVATRMMELDDPRGAGTGSLQLARVHLFQGRSRPGGELAAAAGALLEQRHLDPAEAIGTAVEVRLESGDAIGALDLIRRSRTDAATDVHVAYWKALALGRLGHWAEADALRRRVAERAAESVGPATRRMSKRLDGESSLLRGDAGRAVLELTEAVQLLPERGFCGDHVPTWYALARAQEVAGRQAEAEPWLRRIADASSEHLCWPIPYARSLAMLGRRYADTGREDEAVRAYARFVEMWGDGDMATDAVAEAKLYLAARR